MATFNPAQLPSNEHAYTNLVYFNPKDFATFQAQSGGSQQFFLDLNNFIVRAEKDKGINQGEIGLSKFQREAMQIGKSDILTPKVARIQEQNPLGKIDIVLELIYLDEEFKQVEATTGAAKLHEKFIFVSLRELYAGRFVNSGEQVLLVLYDDQIILKAKITLIEGMDVNLRHHRYGKLTDETEISCTVHKSYAQKLKIQSDKVKANNLLLKKQYATGCII